MDNYEVTEKIREFILGGYAEFSIVQDETEKVPMRQFKYKVSVPKDSRGNPNVWYVSAELSAPGTSVSSDGKSLVYQGYLDRGLSFRVGAKGVRDFNKNAVHGLLWVLKNAGRLPDAVHVYHHGKCSVCGRKLTDLESLRCGIGPTCRKRAYRKE